MLLKTLFLSPWGWALLVAALASPVLAQTQTCDTRQPATASASQFKAGGDGAVLTDTRNGNVWLRCPVGMAWDGNTCSGNSLTYTFREALGVVAELNAAQTAGRSDWRLPTVEELSSIVERRCFKPAIDLKAFPYSPESGFWTDSPVEGVQPRTWVVHFLNGNQYIANKNQTWRLRLIADQ